ncbi:MAG: sulfatase, partial [Planctomycetales bacterium]|nr:sulfatase [Planctomycetales bacterium]
HLTAADKPNFIVINVDDLGYADIGPFGSKTNATPNLDRMAQEGRRLTSYYAAPVCSPSRASLMTGCYPKRTLPIPHVLFPASAVGLHPDEVTVAEVLKSVGYATACVGKWHLGDQPEFLPTRQGFDYYFGLPYSNDMGPGEDGAKSNPGRPLPKPPARRNANGDEVGVRGNGQPPLPLLENERVVERVRADEQATLTRRYTERATNFIREHRDELFFLYMPHTAVHFPLYPADEYRGKSKGGGLLGDWAQEVDWSVGQVLDTIRELNLQTKTLVIFTSDNGGSTSHGSNNGPLRGAKGSTWEGGIRVPTIAWWPEHVPAGTSTDAITSMMDVLPTLAKLSGASLPNGRKLDGVDMESVLIGPAADAGPRDTFCYYRGLNLQAVRVADWKLHLASGELYNLNSDIGEQTNVADKHPDVVQRLRSVADATRDDLGVEGLGPGCRPLGRVKRPLPLIDHQGVVRSGFESTN